MTCFLARRRFSAYRDGDVSGAQARALAAHLADCARCAARWKSYSSALDELAAAPRLTSPEGIAPRLLTRLEVESRGPGLALLFRSVWAARPLIWPSLVPAAFLVAGVVTAAVLLDDPEPLPRVARSSPAAWRAPGIPGTESNPLALVAGMSVPRARLSAQFPAELLEALGEETLFVETVVGRDGSVASVHLLHGNHERAGEVLQALRQELFEPTRYGGRPVAVSLYRLISTMEVRAHVI